MHKAESHPCHQTGNQGDEYGEEQISQVSFGVQMGDSHALVSPGVIARKRGVLDTVLSYPATTVHTRRIATTFHIYKEHSIVFRGGGVQALQLPLPVHLLVVLLQVGVLH